MSNTVYTDGTGAEYSKPLPTLNAALLEEAVAWAVWSSSFDRAHASPQLAEYLKQVPVWDQESWADDDGGMDSAANEICGTSFCISGYAMYATGHAVTKTYRTPEEWAEYYGWPSYEEFRSAYAEYTDEEFTELYLSEEVRRTMPVLEGIDLSALDDETQKYLAEADFVGDDYRWMVGGQALLGLTKFESDALFSGENDIDDVQHWAQEITKSRGLPPLNFDRWTFHVVTDQDKNELVESMYAAEVDFELTERGYESVVRG